MFPTPPVEIQPLMYWFMMPLIVLIIGISKAGFGGGVGIVAVPLMATVFPDPMMMLGVLLPLLIVGDIFSNYHHIGCYHWGHLKWLLVGAVLGMLVGSVMLLGVEHLDMTTTQKTMKMGIGIICLVFVGLQAYRLTGKEVPTLPAHPASGLSIGLIAGTVSTLAHAAGPVAAIYLLQAKVEKRLLVGSLVLFFLILNVSKIPSYLYLDVINEQTMVHALWCMPFIPVGTLIGAWMNRKIAPGPFVVIMYVVAGVTAAKLVYSAWGM